MGSISCTLAQTISTQTDFFSSTEKADRNMTIQQAYDAAFLFLDALYQQGKAEDDLGGMLGGMARMSNGVPMESSYWTDWMRSYWEVIVAPTPAEKALFTALLADQTHSLGETQGDQWYSALLPDGRQIWANLWHGVFQYGSIRSHPRAYDPHTGLSDVNNP
jgi:hypothetical protein